MEFEVYHSVRGNFSGEENVKSNQYEKVAVVEADSLDDVYDMTQNISHSWTKNKGVKIPLKEICRSTSIGDIIRNLNENQSYIVKMVGFKKIENIF